MKKKIYMLIITFMLFLTACKNKEDNKELGDINIREENQERGTEREIEPEKPIDDTQYAVYMYYANISSIVESDFLPTYILSRLNEETQKYLIKNGYENETVLYVIDDTAAHVSSLAQFQALLSDNKILNVNYSFIDEELSFEILE